MMAYKTEVYNVAFEDVERNYFLYMQAEVSRLKVEMERLKQKNNT